MFFPLYAVCVKWKKGGMNMSLQEKLVALRRSRKLSQDEVAEQLNVTRQAISRWESGKSVPSTENLIAIAGLFQVPLQFLVEPGRSLETIAEYEPEGPQEMPPSARSGRRPGVSVQNVLSLCILLLLAFTAVGVHTLLDRDSRGGAVIIPPVDRLMGEPEPEFGIELLHDANRDQIGQESEGTFERQLTEGSPGPVIAFVEGSALLLPNLIQEMRIEGRKTPELMAPNGIMGIFTKDDGSGWTLRAGETLYWEFEKYPFSDGRDQTLAVGHIKKGTLCQSTSYESKEKERYSIQADEDGEYYIYFICCSSDRISLKEGEIGIKKS